MSDSRLHRIFNSSQLIICDYCKGSGLYIEFSENGPDVEQSDCPKCNGEGRLMRIENVTTHPITFSDKILFRKVINR